MRSRAIPALVCLVVAALTAGGAASCSSFSSNDDPAPPATDDGGADGMTMPAACSPDLMRDPLNCGQCAHACGATEACEMGACRPGCADKKVYVSTTGSDTNDGCTIMRPMKTIGAAIARVKAIGAVDHAVTVCRGAYGERDLVIDYPVSLRGGYECTQFTRTKDFGYPGFDAATETIIDDANVGADRATLTVKGAAVTRATVIDGFTINGALNGTARSIAIAVTDGASATFSDLRVEGGGTTTASGIGSRGVFTLGSSPEIARSVIHGGTGTTADNANADVLAVYCSGGAPYLHDLEIDAATTVSRPRSYGVLLDANAKATGPSAWHDVTISGGRGTLLALGLLLAGAQIEVSRAGIRGGQTSCSAANCGVYGVLASASTITMDSSRVYGGDLEGAVDPALGPSIFTIYVDAVLGSTPPSVFTNDIVVTGNGSRSAAPRTAGVLITRSPGTRFVHNTVLVTEPPGGRALETTGIWVAGSSTNVEVDDNLVVGENGTISLGVRLDRNCNVAVGATFKYLRNNALVGLNRLLDVYGSGCAYSTAGTLVDAKALLPDATMTGNVRLAPTCGVDGATCHACNPATTCAPLVVAPWSTTAGSRSPSSAELFTSGGYAMAPGAPCLVAKGAAVLTPPVTVDRKGAARPTPASIGADQLAGACTPP